MSPNGEKVSGVIEGFNELDAVARIKENYSIVVKVTEVGDKPSLMNMQIGKPKLDDKAFTMMCSQFAIIINAGIPIARTVQLIAAKTSNKHLKAMLEKVATDVEAGRSLASSFEDHGSDLLPSTFVETIRAGEESGNLDKAFETIYEHFDKMSKMKAKVRGALAYPMFVLVIAVVVIIVLMVKVVPTFMAIFDSYDSELPAITQSLVALSNFFTKYWPVMAGFAVIAFIAYKFYDNTEDGHLQLTKMQLKMPVIGNIVELNSAAQFANTMASMMASGLPVVRCLSITARTLDNYYISQEVGKLAVKLEEGHSLGASLREAAIMPDILVDMVGVGEETGEMEKTLKTIGGYYDTEVDMATASALAKLEPALLVGLAGFAGYIVIAIYMAMFGIYAVM